MRHTYPELKYVQRVGSKGGWQASQPDKVVSSPRAAELLGIKPQTLRKWRILGKGPATVPMGKRRGYKLADLAKFKDESAAMPPEFRPSLRHPWAYYGPYQISTMRRKS